MNRLILVEDELIIAADLRAQLIRLGYQVIAIAKTGNEAIQIAGKEQPDLALMDINLSGELDGFQTAAQLRALYDIPSIFLTASSGHPNIQLANDSGLLGYLTKPYNIEDLNGLIQMALRHHKLEKELRKSEARFSDLYENAPNAYLTIALDGRIRECNQRFAKIMEQDCPAIIGKSLYDLCSQSGAEKAYKLVAALAQDKTVYDERIQFKKAGGALIWLSLSMKALRDDSGAVFAINAIGQDITARVQAESQIYLQAAALNSAANGIIITDSHGVIQWVNQAFELLTGYSEGEVVGKSTSMLKSGVHDPVFYTQMWKTIQSGKVWRGELTNRCKDGSLYNEEMTITPVKDQNGQITHFIAIKQDVSERVQAEQRLQYLATHDILTELPNRGLFYERLNHALANARRSGQSIAVMYLDSDGFKSANDVYGHQTGDTLLKAIAMRLAAQIRESDTLARMGGDEFTLCLENISNAQDAGGVAKKLVDALQSPIEANGCKIRLTTSIGISIYPDDGQDANELLAKADAALYSTKNDGKNSYRFYSQY